MHSVNDAGTTTIQEFYNGKSIDCSGEQLTYKQILDKDTGWLNGCHNFIQFLLPTNKPSAYNHNAPILVKEDIPIVSMYLETNIDTFGRLLSTVNMREFNHNHLRITRMIECCALVKGNNYALDQFINVLECNMIDVVLMENGLYEFDKITFQFWLDATKYSWPS